MTTAAPVPQIDGHSLVVFLLQVGLLLLLALLLGRLAAKLGLPAVVGELFVGILMGPTVFGHLVPVASAWLLPKSAGQFHLLDVVGQFGVVALVGITGIDIDFRMIWRRRAATLGIGAAGLVIPLLLGIGIGLLVPAALLAAHGDRLVFVLFLGVALSVSSIPVIAKVLTDMRLVHRNIGQLTLATGMVDDALGWVLLSIVAGLVTSAGHPGNIGVALLRLAILMVTTAAVGRPLVRFVMRRLARHAGPGPSVTAAVVVITLCAAAAQALGFDAAFGAFVGGILIGSCGEVEWSTLAPLRIVVTTVFAPLFFATVGLRIDLTLLGRPVVLITAVVVLAVAIVGKFGGAYLGGLASRLTHWEIVALGAGMNARGVVQIVVATVGLQLGVLTSAMYTVLILIAIATSTMAPPILRRAMRHVEQTAEEELRLREHSPLPGEDGTLTS